MVQHLVEFGNVKNMEASMLLISGFKSTKNMIQIFCCKNDEWSLNMARLCGFTCFNNHRCHDEMILTV